MPAENQLPAGQPSVSEQRRIEPASSRSFQPEEEYDYVELEERREREPQRQRRYLDEEDAPAARRYEEESYREPRYGDGRYPERDREPGERYPDRSPTQRFEDDPDDRRLFERQRIQADRFEEDRFGADRYEPRRSVDEPRGRTTAESSRYDQERFGRTNDRSFDGPSLRESQASSAGSSRRDPSFGDIRLGSPAGQGSDAPQPALSQPMEVEAEILDDPW